MIPNNATDYYIRPNGVVTYLLIKNTHPRYYEYIDGYGWMHIEDSFFKTIMRLYEIKHIKDI